MIYKGLRIKTPQASWIKTIQNYDGTAYYSFLYNYKEKNKDSGEWEIKERYIINVLNIIPNGDSEIICTDIIKCKPQITRSKNGQDYLNCIVFINADNVQESKLSQYQGNVYDKNEQTSRVKKVESVDEFKVDMEFDETELPF